MPEASKTKTNGKSKHQDAIALLKSDHRTVEELFEKYEGARSESQKRAIAEKICMELIVHAMIEEEIFYPAVRGEVEEDMLNEAYVEHDGAKVLIAEILAGSPGDDFYDAKVKVLSEEIEHHVHEEEERGKGIFAQARKAEVDLDALGETLARRKEELTTRFKAEGIPAPKPATLSGTTVAKAGRTGASAR